MVAGAYGAPHLSVLLHVAGELLVLGGPVIIQSQKTEAGSVKGSLLLKISLAMKCSAKVRGQIIVS